MKRTRQETVFDKVHRFRGVILVLALPALLITFVLFAMPRGPDGSVFIVAGNRKTAANHHTNSYAVIFDAGSSGSRVHVYCFDENLDLVPIGNELEIFKQKTPGLSAYARNPRKAAESLRQLLQDAESAITPALRYKTPVRVGATAGLRALEGNASDKILQAVRDFLKGKSSLKFKPEWVSVLDGNQEGAFQWVTVNYLLGKLGKKYSETVGIVDLGGGSVQMAYAISERDAVKFPKINAAEESYIKELFLKGTKYFLYVHSYLHYGLLAARVEILKVEGPENPCILNGYRGKLEYGGATHKVLAPRFGSSFTKCRQVAVKALKVNESCAHPKCTFGGVWNGGGGDGQKNLFVASFFFDRAAEAGFIDAKEPVSRVKPADFQAAAKRACELSLEDAKSAFPTVKEANLPYLCMDLTYQYALLVDGFAIGQRQEITLVKKVRYGKALVEAAWPLGSAIEAASSA